MKTHTEPKPRTPSRSHAAPVPNALAHQAQLRSALLRAGVQPRLEIGAVNDPLEREADAVAERVMRMPEPLLPSTASGKEVGGEGKTNLIQTKASPAPTATEASPQLESSLNSLNSGGTPLDASSRAFFEPRFGEDFSQVRLHADTNAAQMADSLNAKAFTLGNNIAFAANQYSANTPAGKNLLGHELAHVVQQQGIDFASPQTTLVQCQSTESREDQDAPWIRNMITEAFPGISESTFDFIYQRTHRILSESHEADTTPSYESLFSSTVKSLFPEELVIIISEININDFIKIGNLVNLIDRDILANEIVPKIHDSQKIAYLLSNYGILQSYESIRNMLIANEEVTPHLIFFIRGYIWNITNANQRQELFGLLQYKTPYHNQRNNVSEEEEKGTMKNIGNVMCNLTSLSMALEYLGFSGRKDKQFEDYQEELRREYWKDKHRTTKEARGAIANVFGANQKQVEFKKPGYRTLLGRALSGMKDYFINRVKPVLNEGCGIILSIRDIAHGHIVQIIDINNEGITVNDPYGKISSSENQWASTNDTGTETGVGKGYLWKWTVHSNLIVKYIEVYWPRNELGMKEVDINHRNQLIESLEPVP